MDSHQSPEGGRRAGETLVIVNAQRRPLAAYVASRDVGSTLNPVHRVTYNASAFALAKRLFGRYSMLFREYETEFR